MIGLPSRPPVPLPFSLSFAAAFWHPSLFSSSLFSCELSELIGGEKRSCLGTGGYDINFSEVVDALQSNHSSVGILDTARMLSRRGLVGGRCCE